MKNAITILVLIGLAIYINRAYKEGNKTQVKIKANGT